MNDPRSHLIVALDVPDRQKALRTVDLLSGHTGYFKVGLELFTREGPRVVEEIRDRGEKTFLDLKLHDIPNTVKGAVRSACRLGIHMLTIHASGGAPMLTAASEEVLSSNSPPLLLAVTALTSLSDKDLQKLGIIGSTEQWVEKLAGLAQSSGIRGLVASSKELPLLRRKFRDAFQLVIAGIRPSGTESQDQSRTATPAEAIRAGANYIVVGRPILRAPDPVAAADSIVDEIQRALQPSS
jgi:orotidine-5'-phosphate decarboxylase